MDRLLEQLAASHAQGLSFEETWRQAIDASREAGLTLSERVRLREQAMSLWASSGSPSPIWVPSEQELNDSNIARLMSARGFASFASFHEWSTEDPNAFWACLIERLQIRFSHSPERILDLSSGSTRPDWLVGAQLNIAESCFRANHEQPAIVSGGPAGELTYVTYGELREAASRVASGLRQLGLKPGDRVAILMPMTSDSVAIYLGLVLAGCAAVSIADSFAAAEIRRRLQIAGAKAIVCLAQFRRGAKSINLYNRLVEADAPQAIVLRSEGVELRPGDVRWERFLGEPEFTPVQTAADHPINILFSSGTTGDPKAIPWDQTTPIKAAADGYLHQDIRPGDVVVWPTNLGWMMGPWLIFASLINRATIGLYDDAPSGTGFGRFVQDAKTTMLGLVPTLVRGWRASKCMEQFDWSSIRCFSSTGEASNAEDMEYLSALAHFKPIIEYCGGTEIGGGYISSTVVQPNVAAAFSTPALGNRFVMLDDDDQPSDQGQLYLVPPCMGLSRTLLNRDHHETYYAGCPRPAGYPPLRRHGDFFTRVPGGYYVAGGRADDTMNLGGIKVSSAEIESVLNRLEQVLETAAIGAPAAGGGPDQLVVYVVMQPESDPNRLKRAMNRALKAELNPLFRVGSVIPVDALPRTASNKVMRRELRRMFESQRA